MNNLFHTYITAQKGTQWYIEILAKDGSGTNIELVSSRPGITFDYDRGLTDTISGGIVKSKVTLSLINENTTFLNWLKGDFQNMPEGSFYMRVYKMQHSAALTNAGYLFYWGGSLLNDFSNLPDAAPAVVLLTAIDDMASLKEVDFDSLTSESSPTFYSLFSKAIQTLRGFDTIYKAGFGFKNEAALLRRADFWEVGTEYTIIIEIANYSGSGDIILLWDLTGGNHAAHKTANGIYEYTYIPQGTGAGIYSYSGHTADVTVLSVRKSSDTIQIPFDPYVYSGSPMSYGSDSVFLKTNFDWKDENMESDTDSFSNIRINKEILIKTEYKKSYRSDTKLVLTKMNFYDVLQNILIHTNSMMLLIRGAWHIVNIANMTEGTFSFYRYNIDGLINQELIDMTKSVDYRSSSGFRYLPGLKKVSCEYAGVDGGNLFNPLEELQINTTYNLGMVQSGAGNYIHFKGELIMQAIMGASTDVDGDHRSYWYLEIKIGAYYLVNPSANEEGVWSTTAGYYKLVSGQRPVRPDRTIWSSISFEIYSPDAPAGDNQLSVKFIPDLTKGYPAQSPAPTEVLTSINTDATTISFIVDDEKPADYIRHSVTNTGEYTLTAEIPDLLFDSLASVGNKGQIEVFDGVDWIPSFATWTDNADLHFGQLLVYELLQLQAAPTMVMDTTLILTNFIDFLDVITLAYNGNNYKMIANKAVYSDDTLRGDFIAIEVTLFSPSFTLGVKRSNVGAPSTMSSALIETYINLYTGDIDTNGGSLHVGDGTIKTNTSDLDTAQGVASQALQDAGAAQLTANSKWTYDATTIDNRADARIESKVGTATEISNLRSGKKADGNYITKSNIGLGAVENKSSATIRSEIEATDIPTLAQTQIAGLSSDLGTIENKADTGITNAATAQTKADVIDDFYAVQSTKKVIFADYINITDIPTTDPSQMGKLWSDHGNVRISGY